MKKLILLAAATAGLAAAPAAANDTVTINARGIVAPLCQLSLTTDATVTVDLYTTAQQDLAEMAAKCNTRAATATVTTANNFNLRSNTRSGPAIPYRLTVAGGGPVNQNTTFSYDPFNTKNALQFSLASAVSQIDTAANTYADIITVTIAPSL